MKEGERVKIVHDVQRYTPSRTYTVPTAAPNLFHVRQEYVKDMHRIWTYARGTEHLEKVWLDKA